MIERPSNSAVEPDAAGATSTSLPDAAPGVVSTPTPIFTPGTRRAAPAVAIGKYRAVFACCLQAEDAPTEKLPS